MRGGERLLELFCELFPEADLYTLVYDRDAMSETINRHKVTPSFIQRLPFGVSRYQMYLPLMPMALESFDLRDYDLVISSESGPAKGVITQPETCHICYTETPMRYLWNMAPEYARTLGPIRRMLWGPIAAWLRVWDYAGAQRVDHFLANSENVRKRIQRYWGREADVIHCPVDCERFTPGDPADEGYLLFVGELTGYKRADLAVDACKTSGRKLVVVGDGPEMSALRRKAGPNVEFTGWVEPAELVRYYRGCSAFLFPGEEDFGITPLEAMACGKPVVAYGRGGALETVVEGETGVFFHEPSSEALNRAVARALEHVWDPDRARRRALEFDRIRIRQQLARYVEEKLETFSATTPRSRP